MKICTGAELGDIIIDDKFKFEKNAGILMSLWVKIRPYPITFHVSLSTVQRYRAACDERSQCRLPKYCVFSYMNIIRLGTTSFRQ